MIAATYTQRAGLEFHEIPPPDISEDEVLVRVEATSICGTDLKIVRNGHRKLRDGQSLILGHEFVGTIERVGRSVSELAVGTIVGVAPNIGCGQCEMCERGLSNLCPDYRAFGITFDGSHAEFVRVPGTAIMQGNVCVLPNSVSPLDATLAEPLSCVVNGQRAVHLQPGDSVLIYGAGPMGLIHLLLALASGAADVFVVDISDARLEFAKSLGATAVCNSSRVPIPDQVAKWTDGLGLNVVITAAPDPKIQAEGLGLLAPFGRLCLFAGLAGTENTVGLDTNAIHYKSLLVSGSTGGSPRDYRTALKLIESGRIGLRPIISHVFALREMERAYQAALSGRGMKIVMVSDHSIKEKRP